MTDILQAIAFSTMYVFPNKSNSDVVVSETVYTTRDDICHCFLPTFHEDIPSHMFFVRAIGRCVFSNNQLNLRFAFKNLSDSWLTGTDVTVNGVTEELIDTGWRSIVKGVSPETDVLKEIRINPVELYFRTSVNTGNVTIKPEFTIFIGIKPFQ